MALFTAAAVGGVLGISATGLVATVSAFALNAAVGIGLSIAAQQLAGQPEGPRFAIQGQLQAAGDVPRSFPLGWTATAGSLVYANTWGKSGKTPNAYLTQVIAVADLPGARLDQLWVNGQLCTIDYSDTSYDQGFPVEEYYDSGSGNNLWVRFYDGSQTAADPFLVNTVSSADRPWPATRVGTGVAYVIVTAQVQEYLWQGFPKYKFALAGIPLYDVSKDSTTGGTGTHRYNDPTTWGGDGDDLPAVQEYNLLRGLKFDGKWFYGLQNISAARLPASNWIAAIQKCRAQVTRDGDIQPMYRAGGEIPINAPVADALDQLNTSCQGRLAEVGGAYNLHVGSPGTSIYSFDDGTVISTEQQRFTPFLGLADTINGITARFPSPLDGWNTQVPPALFNADFEAQDGQRRLLADVPYDLVPYALQVQDLMKSALDEARRARRHTLVLPPEATLAPNDFIDWTSEREDYTGKLFRVDGVVRQPNLDNLVDITEVDPTDYDPPATYVPPVAVPLGPIRPPAQQMTGWQVQPYIVLDANGKARRPAIQVFFDGDLRDVQFVHIQVRLVADGVLALDGDHPYGDVLPDGQQKSVIVSGESIMPAQIYEVRGRYKPLNGRPTDWSAWLQVTTPNVKFGPDDVDYGDIADLINAADEWIGYNTRETIERARKNVLLDIDQDAANYLDKQEIRREVVSTTDNAAARVTAGYTEAIDVATGPNSAIARRLEQLQVEIDGKASVSITNALQASININAGNISANATAITDLGVTVGQNLANAVNLLTADINVVNGKATANANAITALNAEVDGVAASVTMRGQAQASPGGGWARWGVQVRTGAGNNWSSASFFLDTNGSLSRAVFVADQFVITDGTNIRNAFVFQSGVATLNVVNCGTLSAGLVRGSSNNMRMELDNDRIIVAD